MNLIRGQHVMVGVPNKEHIVGVFQEYSIVPGPRMAVVQVELFGQPLLCAAPVDAVSVIDVRTSHECPPIPVRGVDWSAIDYARYDGEGSPIGRGPTEEDAIKDLLEQIADRKNY